MNNLEYERIELSKEVKLEARKIYDILKDALNLNFQSISGHALIMAMLTLLIESSMEHNLPDGLLKLIVNDYLDQFCKLMKEENARKNEMA
jgi:hypothetical protein